MISSVTPLDLNEDHQSHELSSPNQYHSTSSSSSSFSSLSYPILFHPPDQDQEASYYTEPKHLPNDEEAEKIIIPSSGSWDHSAAENHHSSSGKIKLKVWKKEEREENLKEDDGTSVKWMSSKMRMMRKMVVSDQTGSQIATNSMQRFETDNSSNNYSNHSNNNTVRVCSDCHTTKTPLWRGGPRGPKSLCNACGIRQRKARRAMAAAASANGTIVVTSETSVKRNKLQKKENKSKIESASATTHMNKKKRKLGGKPSQSQSRKKLGFEDLRLSLSKNLAAIQQVFPQDEKEAAILLMALSYGLVHG